MKKHTTLTNVDNYNIYKDFIHYCELKQYEGDLVLHKHHKIPKCMGGSNSIDNLILLSVEDHVTAHLLFAECFDVGSFEYNSNLRAARLLNKKSIKDKESLEKIKQSYVGENNPFYGKSHSEGTKKYLSECTSKARTGIDYNTFYGEERAIKERKKRSDSAKRQWERKTDAEKEYSLKKYRETRKRNNKPAWNKGIGKKIIVDGLEFLSVKDATKYFGKSKYKLLKYHNTIIGE